MAETTTVAASLLTILFTAHVVQAGVGGRSDNTAILYLTSDGHGKIPEKHVNRLLPANSVNAIEAVAALSNDRRKRSTVISNVKSMLGRPMPFTNENRVNPFYHALDFFMPEQIRARSYPIHDIPQPDNNIRRTLEVTEDNDGASTRQYRYKSRFLSSSKSNGNSQNLAGQGSAIQEVVATRVQNNEKTNAQKRVLSDKTIDTHSLWRPPITTAAINGFKKTSKHKMIINNISLPDVSESAKQIAILHIPAKQDTQINSHSLNSKAKLTNDHTRNGKGLPIGAKINKGNNKPFLYLPQTGKRVMLANLSNSFVNKIISAERRQDLRPIGLRLRPLPRIPTNLRSSVRQDIFRPPQSFSSSVPLEQLVLEELQPGNYIIDFGPPKGEDIVTEPTTPTTVTETDFTEENLGTESPNSLNAVFVDSSAQIKAAIPAEQLTLESPDSLPISSNLAIFEGSRFPPNNPLIQSGAQPGKSVKAIVNHLRTEPDGSFAIPETQAITEAIIPAANILESSPQGHSFQSFSLNNFPQISSQSHNLPPLHGINSQLGGKELSPTTLQQQANSFQSTSFNNPALTNSFVTAFEQDTKTSNLQPLIGFGHPQQQTLINQGTDLNQASAAPQKETQTSAPFSRVPPLRLGFTRFPGGTSKPGRQPWPQVRRPHSSSGGKTLEQQSEIVSTTAKPNTVRKVTSPPSRSRFRLPSLNFLNPFRLFQRTQRDDNGHIDGINQSYQQQVHQQQLHQQQQQHNNNNNNRAKSEKKVKSFNIFKWLAGNDRKDEDNDNGSVIPLAAGLTFPSSLFGVNAQIRNKLENPVRAKAPAPSHFKVHENYPIYNNNNQNVNVYTSRVGSNQQNANMRPTDQNGIYFKTQEEKSPVYYVINPEALNREVSKSIRPSLKSKQKETLQQKQRDILETENTSNKNSQRRQKSIQQNLFKGNDLSQNTVQKSRIDLPPSFFNARLAELRSRLLQRKVPKALSEISTYAVVPDPNAIEIEPQINPASMQQFAASRSSVAVPTLISFTLSDVLDTATHSSLHNNENAITSRMDSEDTPYYDDINDGDVSASNIVESIVEAPYDFAQNYFGLKDGMALNINNEHSRLKQKNRHKQQSTNTLSSPVDESPNKKLHESLYEDSSRPLFQTSPPVIKISQDLLASQPQSVNFTRVKWGFWQAADMDNKQAIELQRIPSKQLRGRHEDDEDLAEAESTNSIVVIKAIPMDENGSVLGAKNHIQSSTKKSSMKGSYSDPETERVKHSTTAKTTIVTTTAKSPPLRSSSFFSQAMFTSPKQSRTSTIKPDVRFRIMTEPKTQKTKIVSKVSKTRNDVFIPGFHNRRRNFEQKESTLQSITTTTLRPPRTFPRSYYTTNARPILRIDKVKLSQAPETKAKATEMMKRISKYKSRPPSTKIPSARQRETPKYTEPVYESINDKEIDTQRVKQNKFTEVSTEADIFQTAESQTISTMHSKRVDIEQNSNTDQIIRKRKRPQYKSTDRLRALLNRKKRPNDKITQIPNKNNPIESSTQASKLTRPISIEELKKKSHSSPVDRPIAEEPSTTTMGPARRKPQTQQNNRLPSLRRIPSRLLSIRQRNIRKTTDSPMTQQQQDHTEKYEETIIKNDQQQPEQGGGPLLKGWLSKIRNKLASFRASTVQHANTDPRIDDLSEHHTSRSLKTPGNALRFVSNDNSVQYDTEPFNEPPELTTLENLDTSNRFNRSPSRRQHELAQIPSFNSITTVTPVSARKSFSSFSGSQPALPSSTVRQSFAINSQNHQLPEQNANNGNNWDNHQQNRDEKTANPIWQDPAAFLAQWEPSKLHK